MTMAAAELRMPRRKAVPVDERAFDAASSFDEHGSVLLGFAVNALRDRALAEDCVQETFLRAWRSRDSFDPQRGSERTWLFTIARSVIADVLRARTRTVPLIAGEPSEQIPAVGPSDPLERLGLAEALAALSDDHRVVVEAVHVEGLSYAELSDRLGIPVPTLRTRAFYALRSLRNHLTGLETPDV